MFNDLQNAITDMATQQQQLYSHLLSQETSSLTPPSPSLKSSMRKSTHAPSTSDKRQHQDEPTGPSKKKANPHVRFSDASESEDMMHTEEEEASSSKETLSAHPSRLK